MIDSDALTVSQRGVILSGSQVAYTLSGGVHTITTKIPKNIGPGVGYCYWPSGTPVITGIRLAAGRILGFTFTYAPSASTSTSDEWSGQWSSLNEVYHFYTSQLVN